jgi:hypothetical protein
MRNFLGRLVGTILALLSAAVVAMALVWALLRIAKSVNALIGA